MTPIPRAERLIVALDVATPNEAKALVERLGDAARFYKLGLELFMAGGYFELLEWLVKRGNKVFVDLKFFDVPETVRRAVANLRGRGVSFASVHGNQAMMEAAAREKRSEEHTSELQSRLHLVCRLLLEKKKEGVRVFAFIVLET